MSLNTIRVLNFELSNVSIELDGTDAIRLTPIFTQDELSTLRTLVRAWVRGNTTGDVEDFLECVTLSIPSTTTEMKLRLPVAIGKWRKLMLEEAYALRLYYPPGTYLEGRFHVTVDLCTPQLTGRCKPYIVVRKVEEGYSIPKLMGDEALFKLLACAENGITRDQLKEFLKTY